ncbi:MAG: NADH:flavin oxidoreductase [Rhizobiaceae bacterium]|nr:NADH:flavin oxidoreductase [Rhizobiaceae bacterium]
MSGGHDQLFQPFTLRSLTLKNRLVMAPMTRSRSPDGVPTQAVVDYYRRRAEADVGLILTEGTVVNRPSSKNDPRVPHFHGTEALAGWQRVADAVHDAGGKIAPQIWHVGPRLDPRVEWTPPGPVDTASGLVSHDRPRLPAMDERAIEETIAAFADAGEAAVRLGFDAVEIHGAHGYLIDDFFWHVSNTRKDAWGGPTLRERARFGAEVVKAVRAALPADLPLIFRLSQWKGLDYDAMVARMPEEMAEWLEPLADAGVDIFHCSQRRFWEPAFPGSDLNLAGWAKKVSGLPTITVGSVGLTGEFIAGVNGEKSQPQSLDELLRRFDRGDFDLVAVGRAVLADPEWVMKIREGEFGALKSFDPEVLKSYY